MIKVKIDIPIYFGYLVIVFSEDVKAVSDKYELGLDGKWFPAFVQQKRDKANVSCYYIVFDIKQIDHVIIAHEVVHCANWIFFDRGITIDPSNDEPHAYLVGWVTKQVYKYANKNKITININN